MEDEREILRTQRIQAAGRVAQEAFIRSSLVAIDQNYVNGDRKIGSAICIEIGDRFFLSTAAHNFECIPDGGKVTFVAPHPPAGIPLTAIGNNYGEYGKEGTLDTAWVEIERDSAVQANLAGVSLDAIDPYHMMDVEKGHYLMVGIPQAFFQLTSRPEDEENTPILAYFTRPGIQANELDDRLFLSYERQTIRNGEVVDIPHPGGISGGPIWLIPFLKDHEVWSTHKYRLIGLNITYHREQIIGMRMHRWLKLVEDGHLELRPYTRHVLARR